MNKRTAALTCFLIALAAGLILAFSLPGRASGAAARAPCWKRVLNDWSNGRTIGNYPLHCYRDAIRHLPEDLRDYSSAADDINAALQAQIAQRHTRTPQGLDGSSSGNGNKQGGTSTTGTNAGPDRTAYRRAIDNLGTSNADSIPIPLIVLASLGALLLALAAGLATTKRIRALRARRVPPA